MVVDSLSVANDWHSFVDCTLIVVEMKIVAVAAAASLIVVFASVAAETRNSAQPH